MSAETKERLIYKCPVCGGDMACKSGTDKWASHVCEICQALLMVAVKKPLFKVNLGGAEIYIDNEKMAKLLNKGDR